MSKDSLDDWELLSTHKIVMLYTFDEMHALYGREMTVLRLNDDPGAIWFATSRESQKVKHILQNSKIIISARDPILRANVGFHGNATIVDDISIKKSLWRKFWIRFWPTGVESSDLILIRVELL